MQTKLIEILSEATGWMTAAEIADKGKWRSPANVGVSLQQMEKANGSVERRKSPTKKQGNGMAATEWKLTEKTFGEKACDQKSAKSETQRPLTVTSKTQTPVCTNSQTDQKTKVPEGCHRSHPHEDMNETCRRISDLEDDVRRHNESHNRLSAEIMHFLVATQQLTGMEHKPINLQEAEEQIAAAFNLMRGRVEELELAVDVAQQAVATMELAEEQAANDAVDVKDAAVGYLVRVRGKKTRICIKPDNARNAALSAACTYGRADVLALVPVGKAVRGAEWKDAVAA